MRQVSGGKCAPQPINPHPAEEAPLHSSLAVEQITGALLAVPAFLPATVCTGYLFAWSTNFHAFRDRSLVERIFWSLPLSFAISTISAVLIGRFLSLPAVVIFFLVGAAGCILTLGIELRMKRKSGEKWCFSFQPLGASALALALLWIAFTVLSLVDIQRDHRLYMNVAMLDQSARVLWTESVLHTGVPPLNPLYMYGHPAPMRNYYFWYVLCAAVAKMTHISVRGVFTASCVWAGLGFAALIGLYLKHFLQVGVRLRRQFLRSIALATVTGLDLCVVLWNLLRYRIPPPADLEAWSRDGIVSWLHTIFWAPHHLVSMICCMFAFLLASIHTKGSWRNSMLSGALIACALSSAFGLSIYVAFAFFLVAVLWAIEQLAFRSKYSPSLILAAGGAGSLLLLLPYLLDLAHTPSSLNSANSSGATSLFSLAVRQMIPPDGLLASSLFHSLAAGNPPAALNLAKLLLLFPGYSLELGFFFAVFLAFLIPAWRKHVLLTEPQRNLLFMAAAMVPIMSLIRSGILQTNDFAWRSAMFVQFPLLLLASELLMTWRAADHPSGAAAETAGLPGPTPKWLRSIASFALILGVLGTICQAGMFRFLIPIGDAHTPANPAPEARSLSQKAYISAIGYAKLDAAIPQDAVVQFNPEDLGRDRMSMIVNLAGIDHQMAIGADKGGCGSELGGDPAGCPTMANAIDALYVSSSAEQARATCRQFGIQYLVVRVYDPVWKNKNSWVWTLNPVVADIDFRALGCS
jgi:hypothetical protein